MDRDARFLDLATVVNRIPVGRVANYGMVGIAMTSPTTGRIVGQMLSACSPVEEMPWWRVVNSKGELSIARRDPQLASQQAALLRQEGVVVGEDHRVPKAAFLEPGDLMG